MAKVLLEDIKEFNIISKFQILGNIAPHCHRIEPIQENF